MPASTRQNPWPGLVAFTEELQDFFHGRLEEADDLLRRVGRKNLTVLFGQSGLGKSSLLHAGLFPRLRAQGYLPVSIRLDHAPTAPRLSEQVIAAVTRAIIEAGGRWEVRASEKPETLWESFHSRGLFLETAEGRPIRPVFVFDQFEELFAIGQSSEDTRLCASQFLTELADMIENRAPDALEERLDKSPELVKQFIFDDRDYRVLVCLREDYLPHLESLRQLMPSITENRMRLTRMDGARALEAVTQPGGDLITPEVGGQVVRFVAGGRLRSTLGTNDAGDIGGLAELEVEPSLLSLVCRELNNRRLARSLPQITADLLAGSRERILQDFYERCVADQPQAVRAFVEDELVTDSGLRENIALERAQKTLAQRGADPAAIDTLVKRRLLHLEERLDIQRVELTHDVLTAVVKKSRDERQQKEAKLRAEQQALELREKARRQRKRLTYTVAGMAVALVVVSSFGVFSFLQWQNAERQKQQARQARLEAIQEKVRAEQSQGLANRSFDEARLTVDELLTEISQEGLKDVPGLQQLRQGFAEKAVERYQVYVTRRPDDLTVVAGHARALAALGTMNGQIGSFDKALSALGNAIQMQERLVTRQPDAPENRFRLAQTRYELGYLYWSAQNYDKAKLHLQQSVDELEQLASWGKTNRDYGIALARVSDRLATVLDVDATRDRATKYFEQSRNLFRKLCEQYPDDTDCLFGLSLVYHRMYNSEGSDEKSLELLDQALATLEKARKIRPNSPQFLLYRGLYYQDKADQLTRLKRLDDALKSAEEAVASLQSAVKENPLMSRHQAVLAEALQKLAAKLSERGRFGEAKTHYEESREVLELLTKRVDDRPMYATALIQSWEKLAQFHAGTKGDTDDAVAQKQSQLRCLDQAVQLGRKFTKKFPDDSELNFQFAKSLYNRAIFRVGPRLAEGCLRVLRGVHRRLPDSPLCRRPKTDQ